MKRIIALLLVAVMTFTFAACGDTKAKIDGNCGEEIEKDKIKVTATAEFGDAHKLSGGEFVKNHYNNWDLGKAISVKLEIYNGSKDNFQYAYNTVTIEYGDGYTFTADSHNRTTFSDVDVLNQSPLTTETHYFAIEVPDEVVDSDEPIIIHFKDFSIQYR